MIKTLIDLAEKGIMPDFLIRSGIRRMQKERLLWAKSGLFLKLRPSSKLGR